MTLQITSLKASHVLASMIATLSLMACEGPDEVSTVEDTQTATVDAETAYSEASDAVRAAAAADGPLYCDLPMIPGGREAPAMDPQTDSYYSSESPEQIAAFYRIAAQARGKTPQIDAMPGHFEIDLTPGDQSGCQVVVGQIQDGTTLVQVTPHDWASADASKSGEKP